MKTRIAAAIAALGATTGLVAVVSLSATPAQAQMTVFDPTNYSQNLLTAARALSQVNNQIQSLQNEAQMLINQGKNLSKISFPELQELQRKLQQIDTLMGQAQGIDFKVDALDGQFKQLFPANLDQLLRTDQRVAAAKSRLDAAMSSFRQTMGVQNQIVGNVHDDMAELQKLSDKSQSAEGALQVGQATNQLLALTAKQQFQIQTLMAAQFRAESIEQARAGQIEREAREATQRFLGDGRAYTPRH